MMGELCLLIGCIMAFVGAVLLSGFIWDDNDFCFEIGEILMFIGAVIIIACTIKTSTGISIIVAIICGIVGGVTLFQAISEDDKLSVFISVAAIITCVATLVVAFNMPVNTTYECNCGKVYNQSSNAKFCTECGSEIVYEIDKRAGNGTD